MEKVFELTKVGLLAGRYVNGATELVCSHLKDCFATTGCFLWEKPLMHLNFLKKAAPLNQETSKQVETEVESKPGHWPVRPVRQRLAWLPAKHRLIGLVRTHKDGFVLPPAVVRKATWRD